jgi:glutamate/tyrosine decarboxylase-like PLP-dependent enzyme
MSVRYQSGDPSAPPPPPPPAAMSLKASYLQRGSDEERVGTDWVPESSRRARALPLYALIRTLGREGIADLVRRNCTLARRMADRLSRQAGITIVNDVVLNQVLVRFSGGGSRPDDEVTRDTIARVQAEGTCWAGGAVWQRQQVMRISVSNWSTTEDDIDRSAAAILRCYGDATNPARPPSMT